MNVPPPPEPTSNRFWTTLAIVVAVMAIVGAAGFVVVHQIVQSGITKGPDAMFGDQHLKTSVALIELHKVRYGRYPDSLKDLKFTGQWDQIALQSVRYYPNADRTAYFIEGERGWVGKPTLEIPEEFWKGTGYSPGLRPSNEPSSR